MPVLLGAMKKYPDKFEVVGTFGEPFWVGWVTRPEDLDLRDAAIRCLTDVRVAQRTEPGARDAALWSMGQATRAMARAGCVFLAPDLSRRGRRDPRESLALWHSVVSGTLF